MSKKTKPPMNYKPSGFRSVEARIAIAEATAIHAARISVGMTDKEEAIRAHLAASGKYRSVKPGRKLRLPPDAVQSSGRETWKADGECELPNGDIEVHDYKSAAEPKNWGAKQRMAQYRAAEQLQADLARPDGTGPKVTLVVARLDFDGSHDAWQAAGVHEYELNAWLSEKTGRLISIQEEVEQAFMKKVKVRLKYALDVEGVTLEEYEAYHTRMAASMRS